MAEEQLDYGDEEFGGSQKTRYHGDGAIPALADDEIGGEDDEYDDLYNDVNVGENFLQMQRAESLPAGNAGNGSFHDQKPNFPEARPGPEPEAVYPNTVVKKEGLTVNLSQKGVVAEVSNNMGFHMGQKPSVEPVSGPVGNDNGPMVNSNPGQGPVDIPGPGQGQVRPPMDNGATTLFVGELHWWTTDAELENVLSHYGRVKEIKFFDERASGKSKGYCQVDFFDSAAAAACKDGMNGYVFNGRPCVVAFASPQSIRQMGASYNNKSQSQSQSQPVQSQAEPLRRPMNDMAGRGGGNYGRGNWGRGGMNRGGGNMRVRGGIGPKNMNMNMNMNMNTGGFGNGPGGGGFGGPGFGGPPGGFMHPQAMMGGAGFDPGYMGRGAYGGFPGTGFPGMMPQFSGVNVNVNPMGLTGVAPHVNPAFFNRGMMGDTGMGWGGEDHGQSQSQSQGQGQGQRTRESSYGGEDDDSEPYVDHEKLTATRSNAVSRENSEKRHRDERDPGDRDRYDKDYKYKEEKESYRDHHHKKDRNAGYDDDWDRGGQSSTRSRSRSRDDRRHHRSRSRDADYGKRRR